MSLIYLVEDDAALSTELARILELQGFEVAVCEDFARAADEALALDPDCMLLDLKLPGADGHGICRSVRARSTQLPIIMLTSSDSEFDEVMGMNLGADDYVTKPYSPAVLIVRIQAVLRRRSLSESVLTVEHDGVCLNAGNGCVSFEGRTAELTRNEQKILQLLMRNAGVVVTRQEIMCELWETDAFIDDNTLTVNVNRLRKVLSGLGVPDGFLVTRRGVGYMVV